MTTELTPDWQPIDLTPFYDGQVDEEPPTLFPLTEELGAAYIGKVNTFIGEPASCKTWAALIACVVEVQHGNSVVWIDLEDSPSTASNRLRMLGVKREQLPLFRYYRPNTRPPAEAEELSVEQVRRIAELTEEARAVLEADYMARREQFESLARSISGSTLVVIDSMTEAMALYGWSGDSREEVANFHKAMRALITDRGPGLILLDHVVKNQQTRGRWASGSERKIGGLDGSAITFAVQAQFGRGKTGRIRLTVSKDRPGYLNGACSDGTTLGDLTLTSDPDTGAVSWSFEMRSVIDSLRDALNDPVYQAIVDALTREGELTQNGVIRELTPMFTERVVRNGLSVLESWGRVTFEEGPRNSKVYTLVNDLTGAPVVAVPVAVDLSGATATHPMGVARRTHSKRVEETILTEICEFGELIRNPHFLAMVERARRGEVTERDWDD